MSHDRDPASSPTTPQVPSGDGPGGASSALRTSILALAGREGCLNYGGSGCRTLAEEREAQLTVLSKLPRFDGTIGKVIATGGEHVVHLGVTDDHVIKFTLPGEFGFCIDESVLFDSRTLLNRPKLFHRRALPSEYLWRWLVLRKIFGLRTEFEGAMPRTADTSALVISQPFVGETMPGWDEVEAHMQSLGFKRVDNVHFSMPEMNDVVWYRQHDGVLIGDAYPRNFRLEASGAVIPIDLMVNIVPPGASKILPSAIEPFTLQGL